MIAWLDLETTGLDRTRDSILEAAVIFTDDELNVKAFIQQVVWPAGFLDYMHPVVLAMHTKNGLLAAVEREGIPRYEAEGKLLEFAESIPGAEKCQLGGNSVGWDLEFLRLHMPILAKFFDRRVIDMTCLNQLAQRWAPKLYKSRPRPSSQAGTHRALDDAEESLMTARYYRENGLFGFTEPVKDLARAIAHEEAVNLFATKEAV